MHANKYYVLPNRFTVNFEQPFFSLGNSSFLALFQYYVVSEFSRFW